MKAKLRVKRRINKSPIERLEPRAYLAAHIMGSTTVYSTIQAAVNAASPGAVITVDAGTYDETVTVNKSLTLDGANAGVDARGARGAESIVYATQTVFDVAANDVTINGFTIEGDDANIGALQGAGVLMAPSIHGTQVLNNIIQDNVTGIYLSNNSNTDECLIQQNLIQNNFETGNNWQTEEWNGSRGIYTDGTVSGGYLTNVSINANTIENSNFSAGDEDEGIIALQALTAGKQFNISITNNYLASESKALLATNVTNLTFMGNTCTDFDDASSGPVRFEGDANVVNIQYNSIYGNSGPGVAADSSGVTGDSSGFVVDNNNIYQNDGIGVLVIANVYDGPLYAVNDWWGSASGPSGDGPGAGQAVWGNGNSGHGITPTGSAGGDAIFSPWATSLINIANIPAPAAPTGLTAAASSSSSINLTWTAPMSTATSQLVERSTDGVNFTNVATVPPLLNSFTDSGLSSGQTYYYRIVASNTAGASAPTNAASAVPPQYQPPVAPTGLTVVGTTSSSVDLSWSAPTTTFGVVGYTIYRNGVAIATSTTTTYVDTTVSASASYTYAVATLDNTGANSAATPSVTATTIVPGTGLLGTYYSTDTLTNPVLTRVDPTINFTWNGASPATGIAGTDFSVKWIGQFVAPTSETYTFYTNSDDGARLWVNGQELVNDWTQHSSTTDTGTISLVAGRAYSIELDYFQASGNANINLYWSSPTIPQGIIPENDLYPTLAPPTNLAAIPASNTQVNLSWTNSASPTATGFAVQRSTDGINFTTIGTTAATVTTLTDSTVVAGTTYIYRVITNDGALSSVASATATINTAWPTTYLSTLNWVSATAGWGTPQDNLSVGGNPITLNGVTYASGIGTHAASTIVYNLAGAYNTFISSIGIDGEESGKGTGSVDFQVIGDGKVLFDSGVLTSASPTVTFSVSVAGVQTLTLVATNGVAGSINYDHADWAGARLLSAPQAPAAPTGLTAVAISASQINLSWTPPAGSGPNAATGYLVQRSADGVNFTTIATLGAVTTYADANGLSAGSTYTYQVLATNANGTSLASAAASATTIAANAIVTNLSSLAWVSATAGWGTVQDNLSVGGNPITLNGVTYASGIGTHAASTIVYNLAGAYNTFISSIGIDGEESGKGSGSVDFQVIGDGKVLFDSGILTSASPTVTFSVSVAGVQTLTLVATNGVAGSIDFDHADWAGARLLSTPHAPAAPTGLTAVAISASQINLSWTAPTGAGANAVTGYIVQRSTDGVNFNAIATLGAATTYSDTNGLSAGLSYTYQVLATNAAGTSPASAAASAATITANAIVTNLSSLTWTSATTGWGSVQQNLSVGGNTITLRGVTYASGIGAHASSTITYNLAGAYTSFLSDIGIDDEEVGKGLGAVDFQVVGDGKVLFDSGVLTDASPIVSIDVNVTGVQTLTLLANNGIAGNIDYDHADWAGAKLLSIPQASAAPTGLVAVTSSASQINLSWTAPTGAGSASVTGYIVQRSTDGVNFSTIASIGSTTTYFDANALSAGATYTYQILAVDSVGDSAPSASASATTLAANAVITDLSSLPWVSATAGWGTTQQDSSIAGNPLTLRGNTYATGIGTHAASQIVYNLNGAYTNFISDIGIDDEEIGKGLGAVDFQVIADGKVIFDSGVLTDASPVMSLNLNVTGVQTLTLVATNGIAGNIDYDHADWAGARLVS